MTFWEGLTILDYTLAGLLLLLNALIMIAAVTPTDKDDNVLARIKNVVVKIRAFFKFGK